MRRRELLLGGAGLPVAAIAQKVEGFTGTRIRVEVFSDFQCPGCKQLHETTLQALRNDYVSAGKVQIVHREFPLPGHAYAKQAACLACAAEKLGQYRKVSDALFRDQQVWSTNGRLDDTLAKVLPPQDLAKLKALARDPKVVAEVEADMALGMKAPIGQTPTMLVTYKGKTQPIAGAISYPIFRRYIDMLLATP
jgi:protein-disulfide isomerase